jgi:hypothetical protein
VAVERFHFLGQDLLAGLLAEEYQELADGLIHQLPLLGLALAVFRSGCGVSIT